MDFGTIKKKLNMNIYQNVEEYLNDMSQVFINCRLYNGTESPVGRIGVNIRREYDRLLGMYNFVERFQNSQQVHPSVLFRNDLQGKKDKNASEQDQSKNDNENVQKEIVGENNILPVISEVESSKIEEEKIQKNGEQTNQLEHSENKVPISQQFNAPQPVQSQVEKIVPENVQKTDNVNFVQDQNTNQIIEEVQESVPLEIEKPTNEPIVEEQKELIPQPEKDPQTAVNHTLEPENVPETVIPVTPIPDKPQSNPLPDLQSNVQPIVQSEVQTEALPQVPAPNQTENNNEIKQKAPIEAVVQKEIQVESETKKTDEGQIVYEATTPIESEKINVPLENNLKSVIPVEEEVKPVSIPEPITKTLEPTEDQTNDKKDPELKLKEGSEDSLLSGDSPQNSQPNLQPVTKQEPEMKPNISNENQLNPDPFN